MNQCLVMLGGVVIIYGGLNILQYFQVRRTGVEIGIGRFDFGMKLRVQRGKRVKDGAKFWLYIGIPAVVFGLIVFLCGIYVGH